MVAFLSSLRECSSVMAYVQTIDVLLCRKGFSQPARAAGVAPGWFGAKELPVERRLG